MQYESSFNYECGTKNERYTIKCKETLFSGKSKFQHINIYDTFFYGKILVLDGLIQSSQLDEHRYHEALVHPAMTAHPNPQNVLIIGGGEGATAREILKHPSVKSCVMVDIDGELVEHCEKHLSEWHAGAFEDPRLELIIDDGLKYIKECDRIFDVIIIDVCDSFESEGPTDEFFSTSFFRQLKRILELRGVVVYQAMCASMGENEDFSEVFKGLNEVFTYATPYTTYIQSFWSEWGFVVASDVINFSTIPAIQFDKILESRGIKDDLRFFDSQTFRNMFSLPKDIRDVLNEKPVNSEALVYHLLNQMSSSATV